ncbi:MFS general substrate transporter [Auriculariales sp. MPI-PUGE-AT-0066]|nr:MFS general substrate transporter [Auriculariales sp. MPI-PUGE-AT-0066]
MYPHHEDEEHNGEVDDSRWLGEARVRGPHWARMFLSTIGTAGLSIVWSIQMANVVPYVLSLGLARATLSALLLVSAVLGLSVQLIGGSLSDASTSRFGRRRPFMLSGAILCCTALMLLAYTRSIFGETGTTALAVVILSNYCIDLGTNVMFAADSAILVDTFPSEEQSTATAWSARMLGVGSIVGYFFGNMELTRVPVLSFLGDTQLKIIAIAGGVTILSLHAIVCWAVQERARAPEPFSRGIKRPAWSIISAVVELWKTIPDLPATIKHILVIQFFAFLAFYPAMFYASVFVGDAYRRTQAPPLSDSWTQQKTEEEAMRAGSRALLYQAVASFVGTLVLPLFALDESKPLSPSRWRKPMLVEMWMATHALSAACLLSTFWINSVMAASAMLALLGLVNAVGAWAPYAIIAKSLLTSDGGASMHSSSDTLEMREHHTDLAGAAAYEVVPLTPAAIDQEPDDDLEPHSKAAASDANTGAVMGIHNAVTVLPQFVISGVSSLIFSIMEPGGSPGMSGMAGMADMDSGGNATTTAGDGHMFARADVPKQDQGSGALGVIFRIGGVASLVACFLTWRLARRLRSSGV